MQGMDAKNGGLQIIDPTSGYVTTYMYNGDPVMGAGWLDCCIRVDSSIVIGEDGVECLELAGPGGVQLDPPVDVACEWNSTHEFYVTSDHECDFSRMDWRGHIGSDTWEFRFTAAGSEYYDWISDAKFGNRAPFEVWNIGSETPDDPSDDKRIQFFILDDDESGNWTAGDRVYPFEREYPTEPLPQWAEYTWDDDFRIGRIIFNGGVPQTGSIVSFTPMLAESAYVYDTLTADLRYLVSCGPFDMAESDTQEVIMAVLMGQGSDRLTSVAELKKMATLIPRYLTEDWEICNCTNTGDLNMNGICFDIADLVYLIHYALCGGPPPPSDPYCPLINRADFNCDDRVNLVDIVWTVRYIYKYPTMGPCDPCSW
jgi:hypothetical protein